MPAMGCGFAVVRFMASSLPLVAARRTRAQKTATGLLELEVTPTIRHGSAAKKNSHRFSSWQDLASSVNCMLSISHSPRATRATVWIGRLQFLRCDRVTAVEPLDAVERGP